MSAHHRLAQYELMQLEAGNVRNLMLCMPPGSAKSTHGSVFFPTWYIGRNPDKSIIGASHTQELAERFGRRSRNLISSDDYASIFPDVSIAADSSAAHRWETSQGGEYFAAGVGGAVTGRRADLGIIDDPVKSREDADSERMRDRAWDWYVNDFLTRLKPGAKQLVIMTRWHEDDLGGRILNQYGKDWRLIEIAMEALPNDPLGRKQGDLLWPEWYTSEMVDRAKQDVRSWNALYQQQPTSETGDYFNKSWFGEYETLPKDLRLYGASDFAVSEGRGDFSEHGVFGIDADLNIYVKDWWYGQTSPDIWVESWCDLILAHSPLIWFGESGVIKNAVGPLLRQRMNERGAGQRIEWMASIHDKEVRARAIQGRFSMGKVFFPKNAPWKAHVIGQLLRFPSGQHDDAVDVFSLIGRGLDFIGTGRRPKISLDIKQATGAADGWMS